MTPNEFTAWLDGFLDGKDSLTAEQIATLRAKVAQVHAAPVLLPPFPQIGVPTWTAPGTGTPLPFMPFVTCGGITAPHDPNIRLNN